MYYIGISKRKETVMHDIWNPWHGCKKCSEGTDNDIIDIVLDIEFALFHTFSLLFLPRKPLGLTSSITIRIANSIASV